MQSILLATGLSMVLTLLCTPFVIDFFVKRGVGQQVRVDGPTTSMIPGWKASTSSSVAKQGTPTMGGMVILVASTIGYFGSHVRVSGGGLQFRELSTAALLLLGSTWALGLIGAIDDVVSIRQRRSLGLSPTAKLVSQAIVGFFLAYGAMRWVGVEPRISWTGASDISFLPRLPQVVFAVWVILVIQFMSNAVNITDGLDGLAAGGSAMALFVFVVIGFWEFRHPGTYAQLLPVNTPGLLDVAVIAASLLGGCIGFLWWNAAPARIILGDTGALGLGGALAAMGLFTRTQLLLFIIGGLFVVEALSSQIQTRVYQITKRVWPDEQGRGRRVFAMAPLHHHFELKDWAEMTIVVRFWLVAGLAAGLGLALFYTEFLASGGLD